MGWWFPAHPRRRSNHTLPREIASSWRSAPLLAMTCHPLPYWYSRDSLCLASLQMYGYNRVTFIDNPVRRLENMNGKKVLIIDDDLQLLASPGSFPRHLT
jgi:hypothetical protein